MAQVIVIHETDKSDGEKSVIGVASTRENALEMINKYYGEAQHAIINFIDVRDSNIDFKCTIEVEEPYGGTYYVCGEDFIIDVL